MGNPLYQAPTLTVLADAGDAVLEIGHVLLRISTDILKAAPVLHDLVARELQGPLFRHFILMGSAPAITINPQYPDALVLLVRALHSSAAGRDIQLGRDAYKDLAYIALTSKAYGANDFMRPAVARWLTPQMVPDPDDILRMSYHLLALLSVGSPMLEPKIKAVTVFLPPNFDRSSWSADADLPLLFPAELTAELKRRIDAMVEAITAHIHESPARLEQLSDAIYSGRVRSCAECGSHNLYVRRPDVSVCRSCGDETLYQEHCTPTTRAAALAMVLRGCGAWPTGHNGYWAGRSAAVVYAHVRQAEEEMQADHSCSARARCPLKQELDDMLAFIHKVLFGH